jgi:hypothetical protein
MEQNARNAIDETSGHLHHIRYVLHDRDTKSKLRKRGQRQSSVTM